MAAITAQQQPFLAGKKIIVAGGGLAGLSFVIALHKQWSASTSGEGSSPDPITITVYETDTKELSAGREGYSMTIRSDQYSGGMQALSKLGLLEPVLRSANTLRGGFVYWDKDWNEILQVKGGETESLPSVRIARRALLQILVDAVPSGVVINWETSCTGAVHLPTGKVQVSLSSGGVDECDLLVAADGANSKIRASLRPNDKLSFLGAVIIVGEAIFSDGIPEPFNQSCGDALGGDGVGVFVAHVDKNIALWAVSYLAQEPRATMKAPLAREQAQQLLDEALDLGRPFAEPLKTILQATDISKISLINAKDKNPFPHVHGDQKCEQVIFIGDSNHAMSPYAGTGANMAIMDGWDLAEQLCNSSSLLIALKGYDASSMPRSKSVIGRSHWAISMIHAQGWKLMLYVFILRFIKLFSL